MELLSAAVVGLLVRFRRVLYNKYLEWQYPVSGRYITRFEDEINGNEVTITAPAKLEQEGKKVTGSTKMSDDNREWYLEGDISSSGYINGIYHALDPHDRGVGNFFLYINHDKTMEGIWSGYDEVNDKISSGRYTFLPVFNATIYAS